MWIDSLLLFDFDLEHIAGSIMRFVDYFSRNPVQKAPKLSKYAEKFVVAQLGVMINEINEKLGKHARKNN